MPSSADIFAKLQNAYNKNNSNGRGVPVSQLGNIFADCGLGTDSALVRQWQDYFRAKGIDHLSLADLKQCCAIEDFPTPVSQVVIEQPSQPRREYIVQQPRDVIVERPREIIVQQPVREVIVQQPRREVIVQQPIISAPRIYADIIEEPPIIDQHLLNDVGMMNHGGFTNHRATFGDLMAKIEQLEVIEGDRIRDIIAKFGGLRGGAFGAPDILRKMVNYCNELKRENQVLLADVSQNCHQNHKLIDIIEAFMAFEQWWRRQEERIRILLSEVEALKYRVNSLEGENTNLREQIRNYLQEINDLKIKLEEIDYLKLIIERQAWQLGQKGGEVEFYFEQLSTIQAHYAEHLNRIRQVSMELTQKVSQIANHMSQTSFDIPSYQIMHHVTKHDLSLAIKALINAGAARDGPTGTVYYKNRHEAKSVAKLICNLKNDVNEQTHLSNHWDNLVSKGTWDAECSQYFSPNGRLEGRSNIDAFFRHVVDHRNGASGNVIYKDQFGNVINRV